MARQNELLRPRAEAIKSRTAGSASTDSPRPNLTEAEKGRVKKFLTRKLGSIDILDERFDLLIPASLQAVKEMVNTGFLPSQKRGGFYTSMPQSILAYEATEGEREEGDPKLPYYAYPLQAVNITAQRHYLLDALHLPLNLPDADPHLWDYIIKPRNERFLRQHGLKKIDITDALQECRYADGVLIAVKASSIRKDNSGDIPYRNVVSIIGLEGDQIPLLDLLGIEDQHPSYTTHPYKVDGVPINIHDYRYDYYKNATTVYDYDGRNEPSIFYGLDNVDKWNLVGSRRESENRWWIPMEMTQGYLTAPSYQIKVPTIPFNLQGFGEISMIKNRRHRTFDPLVTGEVIQAFYEKYRDKYPDDIAQRVTSALFHPYETVADDRGKQMPESSPPLFADWKKAQLHLWHFDKVADDGVSVDELGISASSIKIAADKKRLGTIQGLDPAGENFLGDLVGEMLQASESEIVKINAAGKIYSYLYHFNYNAIVDNSGTAIIRLRKGEELEVNLWKPDEISEDDLLFKRGVGISEAERGIANLTIGVGDNRTFFHTVITDEDKLSLVLAESKGKGKRFTAREINPLLDGLKAATALTVLPKAIVEVFGTYEEFQKYLQMIGLVWDDREKIGSSDALYLSGLEAMVNRIKNGDEAARQEVTIAENFGDKVGALLEKNKNSSYDE